MQQIRQDEKEVVAPGPGTYKRFYYGWVIIAVCFVVMMLLGPMLASFSVFYVEILRDLQWSRGNTALALSAYMVVSGLSSPIAGGLIDRYGPRLVMPAGALVTALAMIWISQMTTLWQFYIAYGLVGAIGASMLHIVPMSTIISNWFVRNRGLAIGLVTAGQGAGQVGIPLIQSVINSIGWRKAYIVLGAIVFTVPSILILLFLHKKPEDRGLSIEDESSPFKKHRLESGSADISANVERKKFIREVVILDKEWAETEWTVKKAVRTFRLWALMLVMAMFAAGFLMISVQLVAYLTDKGYSSILAASVVGAQGAVNIVGRFAGGALSDRIGREKTLTLSVCSFIICLLLLNTAGAVLSPALLYVFAVFYGMGSGMTLPTLMAAAADLYQGKRFGSILGVITVGGFAGGALGAWLGGYLYDLTHTYYMNFLVATGMMMASAALVWKARPGAVRYVRSVQIN